MTNLEINGNIKDSEMVDGIRFVKEFDLTSISMVENPINPACILVNHNPSKVVGSWKGKKFLFEDKEPNMTQEDIGLSRKELRTKELEQCRDEVRAVLEKYEAQLDGDCNWQVNLSCSDSGDGIYLYKEAYEANKP